MIETLHDGDILQSRFMAHLEPWSDRISLRYGFQTVGDGWTSMGRPPMTKHKPGQIIEPFLEITKDEAQQLMDTLWTCGLRPSEGTGSAGAMAATQAHLKDLQRLVFKTK